MKKITIFSRTDFRKWLMKNHNKESRISVIIYKKYTGESSPSHKELIKEAICFGWIDTTVNRLDDKRYIRNFTKRNKNSRWSDNTLRYAKELMKQKRMAPAGLKFYKEGLKKPTLDYGIPKNPNMPADLKKALGKNKKSEDNFKKFSNSNKKMLYRWILSAKREETKDKRIKLIVDKTKIGKKDIF
jgi:uncharacterized protein YdeI (YjbR/CyaY-like superfamily)